jgi:hypothetical protein
VPLTYSVARHRPVPTFAAGKEACGRDWGRMPLQDRVKVGGGWGRVFDWGVGSTAWFVGRDPSTGSGRTGGGAVVRNGRISAFD